MRTWKHQVNPNWLKARQQVLTATDVANLMPEYKRYLKAGSPDVPTPGFSALWCRKNSDCYLETDSTNAAARGHIMEPYAVGAWNKQADPWFYHWDDCLVVDGTGKLGFSPDAMTDNPAGLEGVASISACNCNAEEVMEVKCYMPEAHMKAIVKPKMEHDELMQLAMAFCVLPDLEKARLVWFCPGAPISMYAEEYDRDDLHDQIRWTMEIAEVYEKTKRYWTMNLLRLPGRMEAMISEDEIYKEYIEDIQSESVFMLK